MKKPVGLFFVFMILVTGCGGGSGLPVSNPISEEIAKETGEKLAEEMLGGIDIEYSEEGSGDVVSWPKQMPADVPVFKYAVIDATMAAPSGDASDNSVVVSFRDVEEGAYEKYRQDLKGAGWEITTSSAYTDDHITAEKGAMTIDVDVDYMGENTAALYFMTYTPTNE